MIDNGSTQVQKQNKGEESLQETARKALAKGLKEGATKKVKDLTEKLIEARRVVANYEKEINAVIAAYEEETRLVKDA